MRISTAGLLPGLAVGLGVGVTLEFTSGTGITLVSSLAAALVAALGVGLAVGLTSVPRDIAGAIDPRAVLARDRQVMLFLTLVAGLTFGLGFGLAVWHGFGHGFGLGVGLVVGAVVGAVVGLVVGLGFGLNKTRWTSYVLARGWLAFRHQLPWPLMAFLADAHQRGVLRQAGATYQFRHLELQRRLATRS